jgi:hypothetical protein
MSIKRIDTPVGRYYLYVVDESLKFEDGGYVLMPSVTTILSLKGSAKLDDLAKAMGKEQLQKLGMNAARRGTCMHAFLENYFICLKNTVNHDKSLIYAQKKTPEDLLNEGFSQEEINKGRDLFYNYLHEGYLDRVKKVLFTERFTWSLKHKFAGTADMGFLEDGAIITDFKSASGLRDGETLEKYEVQLAAYAIAFEEIYTMKVHHTELWISHPMGIQEVRLSGEKMEKRKREFIQLTQDYHKTWNPKEIFYEYCMAT